MCRQVYSKFIISAAAQKTKNALRRTVTWTGCRKA